MANTNTDKSDDFRLYLQEQLNEENTRTDVKCTNYEIEELSNIKPHDPGASFSAMHINIHSLPAKHSQLEIIVSRLKEINVTMDFILLCETFLNNNNDSLYNIPGYNFICQNRQTKKGGGVAIYINDSLSYKRRHDLEYNTDNEYETLFIEAHKHNLNCIVGEIYRVPNTSEIDSLNRFETTINKLNIQKQDVIIGTDQNFDYIKIENHKHTAELLDTFLTSGLLPTITKPTRITNSSCTLIDNIYVNYKTPMYNLNSAVINSDISDHLPVCMFYSKKNKILKLPITVTTRCLNDDKLNKIANDLKTQNWSCLNNKNVDDAFVTFTECLQSKINLHAPEKTKTISPYKIIRNPWITPGLLKSSKTLDKLHKAQLNKPKTHASHIKYTTFKSTYTKLKRKNKNDYYTNLLNNYKNDIRKTWKTLNSIIGRNNGTNNNIDKFENNGDYITEPEKIAEGFCTYFSQIGEKFAASIPNATKPYDQYLSCNKTDKSLFMTPTDPDEVDKIITSMKAKKSSGHDNISTALIKKLKLELKVLISILINKSLETGKVPDMIKIAKVIPIYKAKSPSLYTNYRPISLLPSISKIIEKVVHKRVYNFLNCNNIFYNSQYGFRPKYSTIHAITELTTNIQQSLDNNCDSLGVFLDLSKAFDTINHDTLLKKLHHYGVRGLALDWFRSYLSNRKQFVNFKNVNSEMQAVTCGVPQGSVLGPLLFIIYTNDLPNALRHSRCILFADDTTLYYSSKNMQNTITKISEDLNNLTEWFKANKLSLNVSKTNYIIFSRSNHIVTDTLKIGDEIINNVSNTKFLGVIIDSRLNWHEHIKYCKNKMTSGLYILNCVKRLLASEHLKSIYHTLVHPYINYGLILWGSANKTNTNKIQTTQNKSVRAITLSKYNETVRPIFKTLHILPVDSLYQLHISKFMYQFTKKNLPKPLLNLFTQNIDIHSHNTRHKMDPHITQSSTKASSQSLIHKAPNIWHNIPQHIKELHTIKSFARQIKLFIESK